MVKVNLATLACEAQGYQITGERISPQTSSIPSSTSRPPPSPPPVGRNFVRTRKQSYDKGFQHCITWTGTNCLLARVGTCKMGRICSGKCLFQKTDLPCMMGLRKRTTWFAGEFLCFDLFVSA